MSMLCGSTRHENTKRGINRNISPKSLTCITVIAAVLAGLISWLGVTASASQQTLRMEGYNVPLPVGLRTQEAFSVAVVTVANIGDARWDTKDGKEPSTTGREDNGSIPVIFQLVTLQVETFLKHPLDQRKLTIRKVGGTVGEVTMGSLGGLDLREGQRAIVFFTREFPVGTWKYSSIYTIDGSTAKSAWDRNQLSLNTLLAEITRNSK